MTRTGSRARQEANDRVWHLRGKCRNVKSAALALQPFCAKTCAMVLGSPAGARGGIFGSGTRGTVSGHSRLLYRFCVSNFISTKTFLKSPATQATKNKKWIQRTLRRCTPKEAWQGVRKLAATSKPPVPLGIVLPRFLPSPCAIDALGDSASLARNFNVLSPRGRLGRGPLARHLTLQNAQIGRKMLRSVLAPPSGRGIASLGASECRPRKVRTMSQNCTPA